MNGSFEQFLIENNWRGPTEPTVYPNVNPADLQALYGLAGTAPQPQGQPSSQPQQPIATPPQPTPQGTQAQGQQKEGVDTYSFKTGDGKTKISTPDPDALKSMAGVLGQYPIPEYKPTPMPEKFKPKVGSPLQSLLTALAFIAAPKATVEAMGGYLAGMEKQDKDKMERWQMESEMADRARQAAIQNRQMGIHGQEAMQNAALVGPRLKAAVAEAETKSIEAANYPFFVQADIELRKQGVKSGNLAIALQEQGIKKGDYELLTLPDRTKLDMEATKLQIDQTKVEIARLRNLAGREKDEPTKKKLLDRAEAHDVRLANLQNANATRLENLRSSNQIRETQASVKAQTDATIRLAKLGIGTGGGRGTGSRGTGTTGSLSTGLPGSFVTEQKSLGMATLPPTVHIDNLKQWVANGVIMRPTKEGKYNSEKREPDESKPYQINVNAPKDKLDAFFGSQKILGWISEGYTVDQIMADPQGQSALNMIDRGDPSKRNETVQNLKQFAIKTRTANGTATPPKPPQPGLGLTSSDRGVGAISTPYVNLLLKTPESKLSKVPVTTQALTARLDEASRLKLKSGEAVYLMLKDAVMKAIYSGRFQTETDYKQYLEQLFSRPDNILTPYEMGYLARMWNRERSRPASIRPAPVKTVTPTKRNSSEGFYSFGASRK